MSFAACVVVPVYNHQHKLPILLAALAEHQLPVILVDDGSEAACRDALATMAGATDIHLVRHGENRGKGAAVTTGLFLARQLGFSHALQIDADGQHNVADIATALELARSNPGALVCGQPEFDQTMPRGRRVARHITHFWVGVETLRRRPVDTMCGFRVYPLQPCCALLQTQPCGERMQFDIEFVVRWQWRQLPLCKFATRVIYPQDGSSHFNYWRDNIQISWMHTRLVVGMLRRLPRLLLQRRDRALHWSQMGERGSVWGIKLLLFSYRWLGRWVFELLLLPTIGYFFLTHGPARRASLAYLRRVHALAPTPASRPTWLNSFRHFLAFGRSALDKVASWGGIGQRVPVSFPDEQAFLAAANSGAGGIVLGAHLGNIELSRAVAQNHVGIRVNALMFTDHAEGFNSVLRELNPEAFASVISVASVGPETAVMLQQKIAAGELIVVLADRVPQASGRRVSWVDFLGAQAPFGHGPFMLAYLLQCPVYAMFCVREPQGYQVFFEPFAPAINLPAGQRSAGLAGYAQQYAGLLAGYCQRYPLQWFNFYDYWPQARQTDGQ